MNGTTEPQKRNGRGNGFTYRPRSKEQWQKRADQREEEELREWQDTFPPPEKPLPLRAKKNKRNVAPTSLSTAERSKAIMGALQENILTLLTFDTEAIPELLKVIRADDFDNETYRTIADRTIAYFYKYKKAPGDHLPDLVEEFLTSSKRSHRQLFTDALHDLHDLSKTINRQFVLDQLQNFVRERELRVAITAGAEELQRGNQQETIAALTKGIERAGNAHSGGLLGLDGAALAYKEFRNTEFPPVVLALNPTLPHPGIVQINGYRGDFKSGLGHYMFVGLAAGVDVFGWKCMRPYKVLLVDGEMPLATVQKRIAGVCADLGVDRQLVDRNLTVLDRSKLNRSINVADPSQTDEQVEFFTQFEIVGLDNIKSLVSGVDLNTGIGWETIDALCMRCRDSGTSIVREQHKGKDPNAGSRGASDQEDHVDVVIDVKKSSPKTFHGNTTVRVTYTKPGRDQDPNDFEPIDLEISTGKDGMMKVAHDLSENVKAKVDKEEMKKEITRLIRQGEWKGVNQTKFAEQYDVDKSTVSRKAKEIREDIDKEGSLIR